jgi:hypothetical protein
MYYTGIDPFTKKAAYVAQYLRDCNLQRALLQHFKLENYLEMHKALEQAGHNDLIGSGCDALIPAQPPPVALRQRREQANQAARGEYVHTIPPPRPAEPKMLPPWTKNGQPTSPT